MEQYLMDTNTNWNAKNFRLMECGLNETGSANWKELIPNADNDGQSARISDIQIDGHPGNVTGIVFYEKSTQQVFCYEGTLTGAGRVLLTV